MSIARCPVCTKIISTIFPVHDCRATCNKCGVEVNYSIGVEPHICGLRTAS